MEILLSNYDELSNIFECNIVNKFNSTPIKSILVDPFNLIFKRKKIPVIKDALLTHESTNVSVSNNQMNTNKKSRKESEDVRKLVLGSYHNNRSSWINSKNLNKKKQSIYALKQIPDLPKFIIKSNEDSLIKFKNGECKLILFII